MRKVGAPLQDIFEGRVGARGCAYQPAQPHAVRFERPEHRVPADVLNGAARRRHDLIEGDAQFGDEERAQALQREALAQRVEGAANRRPSQLYTRAGRRWRPFHARVPTGGGRFLW